MESPLQTIERLKQEVRDLQAQLAAVQQGVQPFTHGVSCSKCKVIVAANQVDNSGECFCCVSRAATHPTQQVLDVVAAAKALCKHAARVQNVNFDDYWLIHGEEFKQEAQIVLDAAQAKQGEQANA